MKSKSFILGIVLVLGLITSCNKLVSPVGTWEISTIGDKPASDLEKTFVIEIEKDGTFTRKSDPVERTGTWEINKDKEQIFFIVRDNKGEVKETNEIIKLDKSNFILISRGKEIVMKKK